MPAPSPSPWQWPRIRLKPALVVLGILIGMALIQAATVGLSMRANGDTTPWSRPLIWELTGWMSGYLLLPIPLAAFQNAPVPAAGWRWALAVHIPAFLLFALLDPLLFLGFRHLVYPALGFGEYFYGRWQLLLPMEWLKILIWYVILGVSWTLYAHVQEGRTRALGEARLRSELQEARLQALSAQLDPHFLFNALNTISSVMYEDLGRTDRLLASLGQMLRDGLATEGPWDLARELRHLEAYLDFALARFGDRLRVDVQVREGLGAHPVPRYGLQRLVENALKHNQDQAGVLSVQVRAYLEGEAMVLEVRDDGRGFADPLQALEGPGTGLRNLRDTLALQFGPEATLEVLNPAEGGALVRLWLGAHHG